MASENDKKELVQKVSLLIHQRHGGDFDRAFRHYAGKSSNDSTVDSAELKSLLEDANVGNGFTRGAWVSGIMREVDTNRDGKITAAEFARVIKG